MNNTKTIKKKQEKPQSALIKRFSQLALAEAEKAYQAGEVPIGAVITRGDQVIASSYNLIETNKDATAHAEVLAIRAASAAIGDWRLNECTLTVTLEPCTMCLGAIKQARIGTLVFLAYDPARGACGSLYDLSGDARLGPNPQVIYEFDADPSLEILKKFFTEKRKDNS